MVVDIIDVVKGNRFLVCIRLVSDVVDREAIRLDVRKPLQVFGKTFLDSQYSSAEILCSKL